MRRGLPGRLHPPDRKTSPASPTNHSCTSTPRSASTATPASRHAPSTRYFAEDQLPEEWKSYTEINAKYYGRRARRLAERSARLRGLVRRAPVPRPAGDRQGDRLRFSSTRRAASCVAASPSATAVVASPSSCRPGTPRSADASSPTSAADAAIRSGSASARASGQCAPFEVIERQSRRALAAYELMSSSASSINRSRSYAARIRISMLGLTSGAAWARAIGERRRHLGKRRASRPGQAPLRCRHRAPASRAREEGDDLGECSVERALRRHHERPASAQNRPTVARRRRCRRSAPPASGRGPASAGCRRTAERASRRRCRRDVADLEREVLGRAEKVGTATARGASSPCRSAARRGHRLELADALHGGRVQEHVLGACRRAWRSR